MWHFFKKKQLPVSQIRYVLKLTTQDCFALAEFYDGGFAETALEVRRENERLFLKKTVHHYNAGHTDTRQVAMEPFATFDDFFGQLERFWSEYPLDKERLRNNYGLMCFLSLYRFIFLWGSDSGAEFVEGNIIVMEGKPHVIRRNAEPVPTTWEKVRKLAEASRPSTGLWIRDLDGHNWEDYTFACYSCWRPVKPRRVTEWFFRDTRNETSIWNDFVINCIVRERETGAYYFSHEVADGYAGDHYPRWIYHHIPISAEEVSRLEAAGLLEPAPGY